jgi:flavin reductase (DIM6/NTAB) family NADH-FMN oxidoreductase RutF
MPSIDPASLSERDSYKLLIGSIIPRPIAFVTSLAEDETLNGAPFSYFNIVSSNPPMISLSIQRAGGKQKDTARNILARREFVVHIVDQQNVDKINETAASLPPDQSEIEWAGLTAVQSDKINVPGIREAKVRMECVLEHSALLGGNADFLIGRVLHFHIDDHIYRDGRIDPRGLAAVSRLAGNSYAKIGEIFDLARPK